MSFIFLLVLQMFSSFMELFSKTRCTRYLDIRVNCVSPMSEAVAGKCAPDLLAEDARFPEKKTSTVNHLQLWWTSSTRYSFVRREPR